MATVRTRLMNRLIKNPVSAFYTNAQLSKALHCDPRSIQKALEQLKAEGRVCVTFNSETSARAIEVLP